MTPKQKNFIIVSVTPWDFEYGSNVRDISQELSKNHRVLFVNIPMKRTELRSSKKKWTEDRKSVIQSKKNHYKKVNSNYHIVTTPVIFEPINRLKPSFLFDLLNKTNNKRYAKAIQQAAKDFDFEEYYLINDNDFYSGFYLPDYLIPIKSIYYLRDNFRAMNYWRTHSDRLEPRLITKYDLTLTNSVYLANYAAAFNTSAKYVGQGCDIDYFLQATKDVEKPEDMKSINGPTIGYIGALNSERLDIGLIKFLAEDNPTYQFVLVGPEDQNFKTSDLHQVNNVHFLGSKDFSLLNEYLQSFDVCINPQAINPITIGNYPRKIDEYLAVGKPVVASYTETMTPFETVTYLSKNKKEFSENIRKALAENDESKTKARIALASDHTWKNSVDLMLKYITQS
ncbi:glycosyltransferase [Reichenbachiella agarivorans]|uniref:Glycosyltransferase n=1 Tax=Reichenbachiella agarivorans TaxID=2979464 RepID=A0ABY6CPY4_9BACT|nr:glycosyltransferase [Reichenbachiella agarivorans]UXP32434.1 glycosyltransferase [Reichenbachiella agarivorans]